MPRELNGIKGWVFVLLWSDGYLGGELFRTEGFYCNYLFLLCFANAYLAYHSAHALSSYIGGYVGGFNHGIGVLKV